ncbi:MAG: pseudouridine synthase, partial [Planctomycetota bacterium]
MSEPIRLQVILAHSGCGSRRACEKFIEEGRVTVDGVVVDRLGSKADPETQTVALDGEKVSGPGRMAKSVREAGDKVYYMLNKPRGVLSTNEDPAGRPLAVQLVPEKRRIFCVGRLDKDTEGLLLLTNDGEFTNQLTHPSFGIEKVYMAQVDGMPGRQQIEKLERGVRLAEGRTAGARVRIMKRAVHSSVLELTISEGMNRQVRRMLAAVGLYCRKLKRVGIGPLRLGELPSGTSRLLTPDELRRLQAAIGVAAQAKAAAPAPGPEPEEAEEAGAAPEPELAEKEPASVVSEELEEEPGEDEAGEEEAAVEAPAVEAEASPPGKDHDTEDWEDEEESGAKPEPEPETGREDSVPADRETKDRGAPAEAAGAEDLPLTQQKRERKPWQKREGASEARGGGKPWEKRGRPERGERKPWEKREGGSEAHAGGKPWEKRDRPERGERKPWEKREGGSEARGGGRPWEKRDRPEHGERKPWEKREGGSEARGGGRPWEKRDRPERGERKPWQKREGGSEARGGGRPWEKRDRPERGE